MEKFSQGLKEFAYTIGLFVVIIFASFFAFNRMAKSDNFGSVKAAETASSDNINSDSNDWFGQQVVKFDSIIAATTGIPYEPEVNPLHTIKGQFVDVNNDGKKELLSQENWQGASGWTDHFSIYQLNGLKPNNIFDDFASTSVLFFDSGSIYKAEPFYQDNIPQAYITDLLLTKYDWTGQSYEQSDQIIYPLYPQDTGAETSDIYAQ